MIYVLFRIYAILRNKMYIFYKSNSKCVFIHDKKKVTIVWNCYNNDREKEKIKETKLGGKLGDPSLSGIKGYF